MTHHHSSSLPPPGVLAMQISASISCFFALCVMLSITYHGFFNKVFLKMVFYLSFADFMTSLFLAFGGTGQYTELCFIQGLITNYFGIASFFWSAAICYQVYLVVIYQRIQQDFRFIAMICWIIPLIASLLPLSTSTYGPDEGSPGWCFLDSLHGYPDWLLSFWYIFSFYFWLALIMFFLTYVVIRVSYKLYIDQRGLNQDSHKIVRRILPYPFIVIVCWTVASTVELGIRFGLTNPFTVNGVWDILFNYILPTSQGTLSALVYFIVNHDLTSELKQTMKEIEREKALQEAAQEKEQAKKKLSIKQQQTQQPLPGITKSSSKVDFGIEAARARAKQRELDRQRQAEEQQQQEEEIRLSRSSRYKEGYGVGGEQEEEEDGVYGVDDAEPYYEENDFTRSSEDTHDGPTTSSSGVPKLSSPERVIQRLKLRTANAQAHANATRTMPIINNPPPPPPLSPGLAFGASVSTTTSTPTMAGSSTSSFLATSSYSYNYSTMFRGMAIPSVIGNDSTSSVVQQQHHGTSSTSSSVTSQVGMDIELASCNSRSNPHSYNNTATLSSDHLRNNEMKREEVVNQQVLSENPMHSRQELLPSLPKPRNETDQIVPPPPSSSGLTRLLQDSEAQGNRGTIVNNNDNRDVEVGVPLSTDNEFNNTSIVANSILEPERGSLARDSFLWVDVAHSNSYRGSFIW